MNTYDDDKRKPNRLVHEKSPYLLQHAYNPVDWYPWGTEAFKKAKDENKPIFLSIGYSTCHWCHVMERESFEHQDLADIMNNNFVAIKVDREERPDIDAVYMEVCQAMNGNGGWPLTIIMTPEKVPFVAATYMPKKSILGRIGLMELLPQINEIWTKEYHKIEEQTSMIRFHFSERTTKKPMGKGTIDDNVLYLAFKHLENTFDEENGGFGNAPKFPSPHNLMYLLRYWNRSGDERALKIVEKTLSAMRSGGIYDHIGFGFHRYSTDSTWLVPHFEKMLYDQGMLAIAYSEAYQATGKPEFAETVREIFEYVERYMTSPEGGFYCAEDADSEGVEGKFYGWDIEEIKEILEEADAELFIDHFNVEKSGNFLDESTRQRTGKNILHIKTGPDETARKHNITIEKFQSAIEKSRQKLFKVREKRVHPSKDDKILTDWNGLMIASLAIASRALGELRYTYMAKRCADLILTSTYMRTGSLSHLCSERTETPSFLEDHAFLIWGLIELYETTFETSYLNAALKLNEYLLDNYWDEDNGGFYQTARTSESLLFRKKEVYDGAIPSGNSIAFSNLIRLGRMTGNTELEKKAYEIMKAFSGTISAIPIGYTQFLSGVNFILGPSSEVVIAGDLNSEDTKLMLSQLHKEYLPNKVVMVKPPGTEGNAITRIAEYTENIVMKDGKATAYVCRDLSCKEPTTDPEKMMQLIKDKK
ncbi:thioredoxin domain-containing protein [Methanococcoides orientis]|uniref:thioredoxin domain-containing protein n=1 Tax=Methanococcoides orientis TaxID=2822137 RepID=UPI001E5E6EAA|nr:thioredoxin domain-containing protein [Methanococcoides orientis]UGV41470.1 thioredoxin domain-containing protein [Methanococcoides orientis]